MSSDHILCLEVDKTDLAHTRISDRAVKELRDGEVLMGIENFAFTASNIAYALHGEAENTGSFFLRPTQVGAVFRPGGSSP